MFAAKEVGITEMQMNSLLKNIMKSLIPSSIQSIEANVEALLSNEAINQLPDITVTLEYSQVSRDKGDLDTQDAHNIKPLVDKKSYYISLCDGVSGGFLSRHLSRPVADIMAQYQITDIKDLVSHSEEIALSRKTSIYESSAIRKRLQDTESNEAKGLQNRIDTEHGATTLASCFVHPSDDGTHYVANVYIVGNSAFFVVRKDGFDLERDTVMFSEQCLRNPYYSGVKMAGVGALEIGSSKTYAGQFMEIKKSVRLYPGDVAFFMTDGLAAGILDMLKNPKVHFKNYAGNWNNMFDFFKGLTPEKIEDLRTYFTTTRNISNNDGTSTRSKFLDDDDVTLIRLSVPERTIIDSDEGIS